MQRRRVLAGAAALVGLTGCLGGSRPELGIHTGVGRLHPADERYLTDGLEPGGVRSEYAAAVPDAAGDAVGSAAPDSLAERLDGRRDAEQFHVLTELRSTPTEPLRFGTGQAVGWENGAIRFTTSVTPVESLEGELTTADELVYTAVWTVRPGIEELPDEVELVVET
ncbi:hypothetical protein [Halobaculum sp. MBLA0143]|uniref:hypothetical protein n=1 Tax=Halobaculum sp. MBLA0143 TaxID=3079933 RepID=UPI003523C15A